LSEEEIYLREVGRNILQVKLVRESFRGS